MNIELLREICRQLPGVEEDIKWEDNLCFLIGGKIFCIAHLTIPISVSFKVSQEEFKDLTTRPGLRPASYLARYNWIQTETPDALNRREWEHYLTQSYNLIKSQLPRQIRKELFPEDNEKPPTVRKRIIKIPRRRAGKA